MGKIGRTLVFQQRIEPKTTIYHRPYGTHYELVQEIPNMLKDEETKEAVDHPLHYNKGGIECIDAIREELTEEEFRGFIKGVAAKYIWRERHKGGDEDLEKAIWYLRYLLDGKSQDGEKQSKGPVHTG